MSHAKAAAIYKVPKSSISPKIRRGNCVQKSAGHPLLFSSEEEDVFIKYL